MKKVAILCAILLPVLIFASTLDGNLFDYSAEFGNKAIDGIKDIVDTVGTVTDKVSIFSTISDFNPFSQDGGLFGWLIGDFSTVTDETVSKADFMEALLWEYDDGNISMWRYLALFTKYIFKTKGFYKINDDINFSLDNPYIYPLE